MVSRPFVAQVRTPPQTHHRKTSLRDRCSRQDWSSDDVTGRSVAGCSAGGVVWKIRASEAADRRTGRK
jgi:hypothetical protein